MKQSREQWLEKSENLRGYFARLVEEQGTFCATELELTARWHHLVRQSPANRDEIYFFAHAVELHKDSGCAWMEVQYLVDKWANEVLTEQL